MAKTLQVNQVADAFVSVPGSLTIIRDTVPPSSVNITPVTTWVKYFPHATASFSFSVPVAGKYKITMNGQWRDDSVGTIARVRLIFDEGTGSEQIVGDNENWQWRTPSGFYSWITFEDEIDLDAGSHTVTGYANQLTGSGLFVESTSFPGQAHYMTLMAVTGSGAGGTIVVEDSPVSEVTLPAGSPGTLTDIFTLPVTVTGVDDSVHIVGVANIRPLADSTAEHECNLYLYDDTTYLNEQVPWKRESETVRDLDVWPRVFAFTVTGLSAGGHTLKIKGQTWTSAVGFKALASSFAKATIFRGGLIDIRSEGTTVQDKPRAIDYGSGLDVSDSLGVVSINPKSLWRYMTPTDLPTGAAAPEAVWQFDGGVNSLDDRTVNGHDWTATGTVLYGAAEGLKGLWNNDNYGLTNDLDAGLLTTGAYTFACLASFVYGDDTILIAAQGGGASTQYQCRVLATGQFFNFHQSPTNQSLTYNAGPVFGPVQHVVFTRAADGVTCKVYVDGQLLDTQVAASAPAAGTPNVEFFIGSGSPFGRATVFCGLMTLEEWSAAQVLEHYEFCRKLV